MCVFTAMGIMLCSGITILPFVNNTRIYDINIVIFIHVQQIV